MAETPKTTNALAKEKSPYLLQHAHNPVDWFPWGEDAFAKARKEQKLIFLSIGYSTCHWCHVMEEESFSNDEIAAMLNENFVSIKVDREERPDIDLTYMTFVQATTGHGGWPLNVFLTPDLKPVYGGTYWPPRDQAGRAGFPRVCREVIRSWTEDKENVLKRADVVTEKLEQAFRIARPDNEEDRTLPGREAFGIVLDYFGGQFDHHYGGFGGSPKFPRPVGLNLLLRLHHQFRETEPGRASFALDMATITLHGMARGGMYDHLGDGFHRYSVDELWHVPHFEKMLYDQAQLAVVYLKAWQITGRQAFAETARGIFRYVLRDMRHENGGFFSAEDADSYTDSRKIKKAEGAFYVWLAAEIEKELGPEDGPVFRFCLGVKKDGNVRDYSDPQAEFTGKNILFQARSIARAAEYFKKTPEEIQVILDRSREKLVAVRNQRPHPHLDDKILTAWNGLMISALAKGGQILADEQLTMAAVKAATFIQEEMWRKPGELKRTWRDGTGSIAAFAADYAFLIQGLLDLYEANFDGKWLRWAVTLQEEMDRKYLDKDHGGYFSVLGGQPDTILSMKEDYDGAEPSPNSIAAMNLLRMGKITNRKTFLDEAGNILEALAPQLKESAYSAPALVEAHAYLLDGGQQIVIAAPDAAAAEPLARVVREAYLPNALLILADGSETQAWLATENPALAGMKPIDGKPAAYVCQNFACQAPVTDPAALGKLIGANAPKTPGAEPVE